MKPALNLKTTQAPKRPSLFLGLPTYCGLRYNTMPIIGALQGQKSFERIVTMEVDSSLLASAFNLLLIRALDARDTQGFDWFLLLHADIIPIETQRWLDILWAARCSHPDINAISAVVPIKDTRGVTSTALDTPNIYAPRRLTMREIAEQEETFTDDRLLINTGMLLINLRAPWVDKIRFTIGDALLRLEDGSRAVGVTPEDWDFSRQVRDFGDKVWATSAVKLNHVGRFNFPSWGNWGTEDVDPGDAKPSERPTT